MKITPFLRSASVVVLLIAVTVVVVLLVYQDRLIYFPRTLTPDEARERANAGGLEVLEFESPAGRQLAFVAAPTSVALDRLWLVFSGNAQLALDWSQFCNSHAQPGRAFLLIDYPGYGASEGSPSPARIAATARAALEAFRAQYGDPPRLALLGNSLGGAVALAAAADLGIERVVAGACFLDMLSMARGVVGWPLCHLLRHRFDNVASLTRLEQRGGARVTLFHGSADTLIPVAQGRALANRFGEFVDYHELPEVGHDQVLHAAPELVGDALDRD